MQLNSFNYFRAVAIMLIVAGHSYSIANLSFSSVAEKTLGNIITGGTALFVFISGFMFHHVFYSRFRYRRFVIKKIKQVLVPYMILGALPVAYILVSGANNSDFFSATETGFISEFVVPGVKYFGTGRFLTAYWYVPFVMAMFLLSPLHMWYLKKSSKVQLTLLVLLSLISLFIHRPIDNINVFHSVIYFTPVYMLGMVCSVHREIILSKLKGYEVVLFGSVIALAYIQAVTGHAGNYHKAAFEFAGPDLMYLQKLALCLFFMVWLARFETKQSGLMNNIAATSFTTFFLHPFFIWGIAKMHIIAVSDSWLLLASLTLLILASCIFVAKSVKTVLPSKSRYLIGY